MPRMLLKAYAKLNLALDVVSARSDGYHEMDMLMQSVSCCDFITLETQSRGGKRQNFFWNEPVF